MLTDKTLGRNRKQTSISDKPNERTSVENDRDARVGLTRWNERKQKARQRKQERASLKSNLTQDCTYQPGHSLAKFNECFANGFERCKTSFASTDNPLSPHHLDLDKPLTPSSLLGIFLFLCQERTPDLLFHMKMPRVSEMFLLVAFLSQPIHQTIKPSHHKTIKPSIRK